MNTIEFLKANEHKGTEDFVSKAQYLKDNWIWLRYSYAIAVKVRRRMTEMGITQKQLAESLGCSQQHISVLLNGKVNMTLETLAKLEKALRLDLIGSRLETSDYPIVSKETRVYLNDPSANDSEYVSGTKSLVEGYKPRKKKGPKENKQVE